MSSARALRGNPLSSATLSRPTEGHQPAAGHPAPGGVTCTPIPQFGEPILRGAFELRAAHDRQEVAQLQALRAQSFRGTAAASDADRHDATCLHLWIGRPGGPPLATLRLRQHGDAASLCNGYSGGFFDLSALARLPGTVLEIGRLTLRRDAAHAQLMRLVWTGIARVTRQTGAARLIGCTSLAGGDPACHGAVLDHVARHHLGPSALRPAARSPCRTLLQARPACPPVTGNQPQRPPADLPTILRFYTSLGGWVSDAVVIDPDLDTCVLFTCVEIATMPPAQQRLMQSLAAR
ncbi:MAG: GNAT family N-acetyltransferase [Pararhodobacter sp.]